jgi:excisionase family DNA binding protein
MSERFLKFQEVQAMFGISRTTLWRWTQERGLKVVRIGDVVRVRESDLQTFVKAHETASINNMEEKVEKIENRGLTLQAACGNENAR